MIYNLNNLRDEAYANACNHGFHNEILSNEHYLCLVISELMEAVEADRKGRYLTKEDLKNYKIVQKNRFYGTMFDNYIKDTVEDELADASIRILDLAGLVDIKIRNFTNEEVEDLCESCNDETFTESVYAISTMPVKQECEYGYKFDKLLNNMLLAIIGLSKHLGIDLVWHIEQKMEYNKMRSYKHGKQY